MLFKNRIIILVVKLVIRLKKYTQEKVAELTDTSVTYISQLELGHHTPSFEKLELLSKALDVEPFEFYVKRDFKKLPARVDMTNTDE